MPIPRCGPAIVLGFSLIAATRSYAQVVYQQEGAEVPSEVQRRLTQIRERARLATFTVTSYERPVEKQAQLMFDLLRCSFSPRQCPGISDVKALYCYLGDNAVDALMLMDDRTWNDRTTGIAALSGTLRAQLVSAGSDRTCLMHVVGDGISSPNHAIDVGPSSVADKPAFEAAVSLQAGVVAARFFTPGAAENSYHIEFPRVPGVPTNLTESAGAATVSLTWNAPASGADVTSYVIEAGYSPGNSDAASFDTGVTATEFHSGPVAAGTYYIRVRGKGAGGIGPPSNERTVHISGGCTIPTAPSGLRHTVSNSTVSFSWSAPTGATPSSYVLEAGTATGLTNAAVLELTNLATTYTATDVPGGTYFVRTKARNACGLSGPSNEIVVAVGAAPTPIPGGITFSFDAGVSDNNQSVIRNGINDAYAYLQSQFQWQLAHGITVHATTSSDFPPARGGDDGITVNTGNSVWVMSGAPNRPKIMLHELFHVLQSHSGWGSSLLWLVEGSAEFVGYKGALIDKGILSAEQARGCHVWNVSFSTPALGPLQNYESGYGGGTPYSLFYLAVENLLGGRSIGLLKTVTNFVNSFGVPQSSFYGSFEQYRATLQRPSSYQCFP